MQVWNVLHAARCKYRTQKVVKKSPSGHHHTTLSGHIFATKARIDNRKKDLLSRNISSTHSHNIGPVVWGTPANFNGVRVLAALLHATPVLGVSQTLRHHLYSAGRPWRRALAHILVALITGTQSTTGAESEARAVARGKMVWWQWVKHNWN